MAEVTPEIPGSVPLWLDCDPGHDDAFAILLAAHNPHLNLLGISTVHGNAPLESTTRNALSILTAIGRPDVPVHPGAAKPFSRPAVHASNIHGETGLDGTTLLPKPTAAPIDKPNAILAMRHALLEQPKGTAWLVATGTLTNVALLFAIFPELVGHLKGLSIMGGSVGGDFEGLHWRDEGKSERRIGNVTPWAEFNVYCDPEAAESIFSNAELAAKTTLIALDLTHQVMATPEVQQKLLHQSQPPDPARPPSTLRRLFNDLLMFFAATYNRVFGVSAGPPLHDPIAVAVLFQQVCKSESSEPAFNDNGGERWDVKVVTDGQHKSASPEGKSDQNQVGRTLVTASPSGVAGVTIPRTMNVTWFWSTIDDALSCAEAATVQSDPPS